MRLFDQYKNLRRENYVLFFGRVVTNLGAMVWPMLTLIMNQKMGMSASTVAVVMVVSGIVLLPVSILGGRLADRYDKKMLIVVCDTISVVFYIICGIVPLSYITIVLMVLAAACQSAEGPAYDALIADITLTEDRERAYSLQYLGANLGLVLSPTIAGVLFRNALWLMFIISGVAIGCSTLLIYLKVKDTTPVKETSAISEYQSARGEAGLITVLKENPVILLYVVAMALNTSAYRQFSYLMPLDLGRVHGEEGALIFGTVNSLNCLIVILCTPLITTWFTRLTETKKTMAGFLLQTVGFVVFASMLGHVPWYYAAIILFTWGEIFTTVASGPYISSRVPASHRGRMNGVFSVIVAVFMSVSQLITGHLFDTLGSTSAWIFTYAIDAGAIVLCVWLIFSDRKRYPKLYVSPADRL